MTPQEQIFVSQAVYDRVKRRADEGSDEAKEWLSMLVATQPLPMTPPRASSKPPIDWRASVRIADVDAQPLQPFTEGVMIDMLLLAKERLESTEAEAEKARKRAILEEMGDEMLLAVHRAGRMPKPRRAPFPNPEALAWRPKW
jgi:hypothetical protein